MIDNQAFPWTTAFKKIIFVLIHCSLLGGVQLFGMIKMLGLLKEDMSSTQNEWAWYGYQVRSIFYFITKFKLKSEIKISLDFKWSKTGWFENGLDLKLNHLKSRQNDRNLNGPCYEWLGL